MQHNGLELEDTKGVIISRKSKNKGQKDQHRPKRLKQKSTNGPQNNTQKNKDWATRTTLKTGVNSGVGVVR